MIQGGGTGAPPVIATVRGTSFVTLSGAVGISELRALAGSLTSLDQGAWTAMLDSSYKAAMSGVAPEDLGHGVTLFRSADVASVACGDGPGSLSSRCGRALSESPLVIALPSNGSHLVIGCVGANIGGQPITVNGHDTTTENRECGRVFRTLIDGQHLSVGLRQGDIPTVLEFDLASDI